MRELEAERERAFLGAQYFTIGWWWAGDLQAHLRWFALREQERSTLYSVNFDIARKPDYWSTLEAWAATDPADRKRREALLVEHRARIARITARMVL